MGRLNTLHYASEKCKRGEERRIIRNTLHHYFKEIQVLFQINAETLPPLEDFPYLGRTIAYNNRDWAAVYQNMKKSRMRWEMVSRLLESTGAMVWAQRAMYKVVVQLVLLYDSKIWVVTREMLKLLGGLYYRAA